MRAFKKYKQLKLGINPLEDHYHGVVLQFRLNRRPVYGILNGSCNDWYFQSDSPAFLRYFPSGILHKYNLWTDSVPLKISEVYNGILESALKCGYDLADKEECVG